MTGKPFFYLLSMILLVAVISCAPKKLVVDATFCENKAEAMGVDPENFRFSWNMTSPDRGVEQTAYRILLSENESDLAREKADWDSGKTESSQSIWVNYSGPKLSPGTTYYWSVKVWDNKGNESDWSKPARLTTGLFSAGDWSHARWIALDELDSAQRIVPGIHVPMFNPQWKDVKTGGQALPIFRKEFSVKKGLKEALVFVTGLGQYELRLNGEKVGNHFMAPGWTNYDQSCFYNIYDMTARLKSGENALGMMLGNGFYNIPNTRYRKLIAAYGNPKMILKLRLKYEDGSEETVVSDESWKVSESPVTYSSIYAGETYDATREQAGWDTPGFDDSGWKPALVVSAPNQKLLAEQDYPVAVCDTIGLKSVQAIPTVANSYLYDFGQNASGIVELEVKGSKGDTVKLYPAELIKPSLEAEQAATGSPYYFTYILKGEGVEKWTPRFTFTGFRYVQVVGAVPDTLKTPGHLPRIVGMKFLHTRNSAPQVGHFTTSSDLFNRINQLIKWAIKSNLHSVATDCPHREKLGWLEQTYLMGGGIQFNYDIYHLYCKMLDDMAEAQTPEGLVPDIVPEYTQFSDGFRDSPEWGSAAIIVPWMIYQYYGDIRPMEKAWPMMVRYLGYLESKSKNHILSHGLGDWYDLGPQLPGVAQLTPIPVTATAIYYYDAYLMGRMAELLGKTDDVKKYTDRASEIQTAFNKEFLDPETHVYSTGSQTAISMPLVLGIVPDSLNSKVFQTLVASIEKSGKALTAGDIGFHFLVKALQEGGAGDLLFEMNARDDVPGYGYQLKKGATALTESWAALERVSNNHLMLGHLMEWFYSGLGGIGQTARSVAYKETVIAPQMVNGIDSSSVDFMTPYGKISSNWAKSPEGIAVEVEVPVNASAQIVLPTAKSENVTESGVAIADLSDVKQVNLDHGNVTLKVGSGHYTFLVKQGPAAK